MTVPGRVSTARSRWIDWQPNGRSLGDTPEKEPTKPSERGSVGFEGALPAEIAKIAPEQEHSQQTIESSGLAGSPDSPAETPECLDINDQLHHPGKSPVDSSPPVEQFMSWADWKAAELNRLFLEQGSSGQPGRITSDTVRHGERRRPRDSDE